MVAYSLDRVSLCVASGHCAVAGSRNVSIPGSGVPESYTAADIGALSFLKARDRTLAHHKLAIVKL